MELLFRKCFRCKYSIHHLVHGINNPMVLTGGLNPATATISNVNGLGPDNVPTNDLATSQISAVEPTPNKLVVGEEATGTWCGWCPRGAVALNWLDKDYYGYFQGIAVHNGDPMTDVDYSRNGCWWISFWICK